MKTYALIGKKLGHSLSAGMFNSRFADKGVDARYVLRELADISELPEFLDSCPDIAGFNVTVPYKQSVIPFLDSLSPEAREIGAVNCVKVERAEGKRRLTGFNTDVEGFTEMIPPEFRRSPALALVLGTGGAAKAAAYALRQLGIAVKFVSRARKPLAETYDGLDPLLVETADIIVNATPLGMWPDVDSAPPLDYSLICPGQLCLDCVYNPEDTLFVRLCRERGATALSGMAMLEGQARGNARIWNLDIF